MFNIQTAACRPATFLNYIYNTYFVPIHNANSFTGMCAQGFSAGSAAVAYSLVWYGAASYVNNVELLSGPVFSDIDLGCEVDTVPTPNVNICANNQYGCSPGTMAEVQPPNAWLDSPLYISGYRDAVASWTGDQSCNNGSVTTGNSNSKWKAQSIITGTGGNFSFSTVGMGGWACYSNVSCNPTKGCPNNSAAQGEQLYQMFTNRSNAPVAYMLTGIAQCNGAEGVAQGTDPDPDGHGTTLGQTAIENHMTFNCQPQQ